jgi:hypothetical protein
MMGFFLFNADTVVMYMFSDSFRLCSYLQML